MLKPPVIAAFDFDGTLTYHDTLLPFLLFISGYFSTTMKLLKAAPPLLGFPLGLTSRQEAKESLLTSFLKGMPIEDLKEYGNKYASSVLNRHLKKEGMEKLKMHQEAKHRCVLVSANLDVYLTPWAKLNGFQDLLCSQVAIDSTTDQVTGKLEGTNCWGEEKRKRLLALLGPKENYILYAYGDSRGDKEMLELADYPHQF